MFVLGDIDERFDHPGHDVAEAAAWRQSQLIGVLASQFALFGLIWLSMLSGAVYLLFRRLAFPS